MEKAYWLFNHISPGGHASPRLPYTVRMSLKATPPVGKPDLWLPRGQGGGGMDWELGLADANYYT